MDRSKNYLINQSIKEFVERQAVAEQRWQKTLPALESMRAARGVPTEKVYGWLRSEGTDNELPRPKSE